MSQDSFSPAPAPDVFALLGELEKLVIEGNSVALTNHKIVDEDAFFVAVQRVKAALPVALKERVAANEAHKSPAGVLSSRLHREETVLLLIDVQGKLLPAMHQPERVEKNCALLLRTARQLEIPVLITEHYPERLGSTLPSLRELAPDATVISKIRFSACVESTLAALEKIHRKTVLLCGLEAHICALQTALDLRERGYAIFTARDAISSRTPENWDVGWQRMLSAGVLPTSTESAIYELLQEAGTPDFKALLPFVK